MQFESILRGLSFRPTSAKEAVHRLAEGARLTLEREPGNPHDENAIRVMEPESGEFIGYIAREHAGDIAFQMDSGVEFFVTVTGFMKPGMPILQIDDKLGDPTDYDEAAEVA